MTVRMRELTLHDRLLRREMGGSTRYSKVRGIYGDRKWAENLDIVNELGDHTGCVNALSWSRSGNLLASGSDDTYVNIQSYHPENMTAQFSLATSICTGHTRNIFSVKFMPHSNDQTVISAAGDSTIRIFDLEYSATSNRPPSRTRSGSASVWAHARRDRGDTNVKVFRSHSDRVKRIVTESSPFLFLSCPEDGEVRQWDLREPESTYPNYGDNAPPPLITYRRYNVELNTISCSPSRPYHIALGGSHLHCFLHDRRMLGRDVLAERGMPSSATSESTRDDLLMSQATQCVRRLAPNGQPRMGRTDSGHITACKISDADPNELIASWSGDKIYSFDITRASEAREESAPSRKKSSSLVCTSANGKVKESRDRKRKRAKVGSGMSSEAEQRTASRIRPSGASTATQQPEDLSLRVRYANGQREDIPIEPPTARNPMAESRGAELTDSERKSFKIAKGTVLLRRCIFSPDADEAGSPHHGLSAPSFSRGLTIALSLVSSVDDIMRSWRYPVNPLPADVTLQRQLRKDRERTARFVQASGTLVRVLGGRLRTTGGANAELAQLEAFAKIKPALNEQYPIPVREHFSYDFLKAICLWLDSGPGGIVRGFSKKTPSTRFPVVPAEGEEEAGIDALDSQLFPYLLRLAGDEPIVNVEASPFEIDDSRIVFSSEKAAVLAFARAVEIPFEDLATGVVGPATPSVANRLAAQDRTVALRFWGLKVARGVLINAADGLNFRCADHAFGGLGRADDEIRTSELRLARVGKIICTETEDVAEAVDVVQEGSSSRDRMGAPETDPTHRIEDHNENVQREIRAPFDFLATLTDMMAEEADVDDVDETFEVDDEDENASPFEDMDEEPEEDDSDAADSDTEHEENRVDIDDDDSEDEQSQHVVYRNRRFSINHRSKVHLNVPVSSHTRSYSGHSNVKTVKDVNFWGLDDEYVVSGSDPGHLFIWDRKTARLVNILLGDGEVVNVIQGHPYEPMMAVSGIDSTIKIFNADARARKDARLGIGVKKADVDAFSSITYWGRRRGRLQRPSLDAESNLPATVTEAEAQATAERRLWAGNAADESEEDEDGRGNGPPVAENGLSSMKRMWEEYSIRSHNDTVRRGPGRGDSISRGVFLNLMGRLRAQMEDGDGDIRQLVVDEDPCAVSDTAPRPSLEVASNVA